jgi:hypothetical protein
MDNAIVDLPKGMVNGIASSILPQKYKENIYIDNTDNIEDKKIIICTHKDISKKDIDTLSLYGKVIFLDESYDNVDPTKLIFDFLIIDLRKEMNRNYYKIYLYKNQNYYYVLYRFWFETNNGIFYNNEITEFPSQQSSKTNYYKVLLLENVYEPKWYVSLFRLCCINK